jgi:hypothetical protein
VYVQAPAASQAVWLAAASPLMSAAAHAAKSAATQYSTSVSTIAARTSVTVNVAVAKLGL